MLYLEMKQFNYYKKMLFQEPVMVIGYQDHVNIIRLFFSIPKLKDEIICDKLCQHFQFIKLKGMVICQKLFCGV